MVTKLRTFLETIMHGVNPCNAPEDSLRWRVACLLFPECWCCAGLRGMIYGVVIMGGIWWAVG